MDSSVPLGMAPGHYREHPLVGSIYTNYDEYGWLVIVLNILFVPFAMYACFFDVRTYGLILEWIPYWSVNGYSLCMFNYGESFLDLVGVLITITETAALNLETPPTWANYAEEDPTTQMLKTYFEDPKIGGGPITSKLQYNEITGITNPAYDDMLAAPAYGWYEITDVRLEIVDGRKSYEYWDMWLLST